MAEVQKVDLRLATDAGIIGQHPLPHVLGYLLVGAVIPHEETSIYVELELSQKALARRLRSCNDPSNAFLDLPT